MAGGGVLGGRARAFPIHLQMSVSLPSILRNCHSITFQHRQLTKGGNERGQPPHFTPGAGPTSSSTTYMLEETQMNHASDIWSYNVLVYSAEKNILKTHVFIFSREGLRVEFGLVTSLVTNSLSVPNSEGSKLNHAEPKATTLLPTPCRLYQHDFSFTAKNLCQET